MDRNEAPPAYEVAVVGHRGFLGSAITQEFAANDVRVVGFGMDSPALRHGVLDPAISEGGVRTVVWCAARINPRLAQTEPELVERDAADLQAFIAAAASLSRPPRIILLSSGGTVYGPPAQPPYAESDEPAPVNAYGEAKLAHERIALDGGIDATVLRVSNAYGPGQRPAPGQGVLAHWMTSVRDGVPVRVFGDPAATRDYVFVNDIARAVQAVHRAEVAPPVVNIGSGKATTLGELLDALRVAIAPATVVEEHEPARDTDTSHSVLDISLARTALGWEPRTSLHDGVRAMWDWFAS